MQRHRGQASRRGETFPVLSDPVRIARRAIDLAKDERVVGQPAGADRNTQLERRLAMLTQRLERARWKADGAAAALRFRRLDPQAMRLRLFDRPLDAEPA